jgi:hypothetical protein
MYIYIYIYGHISDFIAQVLAVSCQGSEPSFVISKRFSISEGVILLISMTISGVPSASQLPKSVEQQIVAAVADSLGLAVGLVSIDSIKDARRRLLTISTTLRVLATDADNAANLQKKAQDADLQVCMQPVLD